MGATSTLLRAERRAPVDGRTRITLCGPLRVEIGGQRVDDALPGRQGRIAFVYLVAHRHRPVSRDELMAAVWSERSPADPVAALSTILSRLRQVLPPGVLEGRTHLTLELGADVWVDAEAAEEATAEAERRLAAEEYEAALEHAAIALEIINHRFLPDVQDTWAAERRRALEDLQPALLECSTRAGMMLGGSAALVAAERAARELVEREPYRESGYMLLMETHSRRGNVAEALRVYERLRVLLRDELGSPPSAAVTQLHERLLQNGSAPSAPASASEPALPQAEPRRPPRGLPTMLSLASQRPLVGRGDALRELRLRARLAEGGSLQCVLITGEPGIGKTRLLAATAQEAHAAGWTVLYGRADEEPVVLYQPVVEALRPFIAVHEDGFDAALEPELAELGRIVPELRRFVPLREPAAADSDLRRYRMFEAVASVLSVAARSAPVVLALDDLHWADRPTRLLLRHVLRSARDLPVLVLCTSRDTEASLRELTGDLQREGLLNRVALTGIDEHETATLIEAECHRPAHPEFVRRLRQETSGNPFFIQETLRWLETAGAGGERFEADALDGMGVPDGVKEVIGRRLEALGPETTAVLSAGAVLGRAFEVSTLRRLIDVATDTILGCLEQAVEAGLLVEHPQRADRFAFRHALVRERLYSLGSAGRRARLHLRAGEAYEALAERGLASPGDLALHFWHARDVGGAEKAVRYAAAAAALARESHADEDGALHYERALAAGERRPPDERLECALRVGLGECRVRSGDASGRETLAEAAEAARRLGEGDLLGRCALAAGPFNLSPGIVEQPLVELLEDALALTAGTMRARLLARLAVALYWSSQEEQRAALAREAVAVAREAGDKATLAVALGGLHVARWVSERPAEAVAEVDEVLRLAEDVGDDELALRARSWRVNHRLALADMAGVDADIDRFDELARKLRQPRGLWYAPLFHGIRAVLDGRFADAEGLLQHAATLGRQVAPNMSDLLVGSQMLFLRWHQGRLAEIAPALRAFAAGYERIPAWRCALALVESELEDRGQTQAALDAIAAQGLESVPRDNMWFVSLAMLADACGFAGDAALAAELERLLAPYAGICVVAPDAACLGPVDRVLGRLACVRGDRAGAQARYDAALALCERLGSAPHTAIVEIDYATLLAGEPRGRALAQDALKTARALGLARVEQRALRLLGAP